MLRGQFLRFPPLVPLSVYSVGHSSESSPSSIRAHSRNSRATPPAPSLRPPRFRVFRVFRGPLFRIPSPPFASLRAIRGQLLRSPSSLRLSCLSCVSWLNELRLRPVSSVYSAGHSSDSRFFVFNPSVPKATTDLPHSPPAQLAALHRPPHGQDPSHFFRPAGLKIPLQRFDQDRQICRRGFPNQLQVHFTVIVRDDVSHPAHGAKRQRRKLRLRVGSQPTRRLTDDFKPTQDGVLFFSIAEKRFSTDSGEIAPDQACRIEHVGQQPCLTFIEHKVRPARPKSPGAETGFCSFRPRADSTNPPDTRAAAPVHPAAPPSRTAPDSNPAKTPPTDLRRCWPEPSHRPASQRPLTAKPGGARKPVAPLPADARAKEEMAGTNSWLPFNLNPAGWQVAAPTPADRFTPTFPPPSPDTSLRPPPVRVVRVARGPLF